MTTPDAHDDAHGMDPQIIRNTPDDLSAAGGEPGTAGLPDAPDGPGDPVERPHGPSDRLGPGSPVDEAALRALMLEAVSGITASPEALERIRRAVPLRRQRRRQALVGAAAAVLLAGLSVPALLRAATSEHETHAAVAAVQGSHTGAPDEDGHANALGDSGSSSGPTSPDPGGTTPHPHPTTGGAGTPSSPPMPPGSVPPAPPCSGAQLGQGTSKADAPDAGGRVYGWFRVANVSGAACSVPSGSVVQAVTKGAADPSKIQVVDHTSGDAAVGLPTAPSNGPVVLSPGQRYEVAFAWVPAGDGPGGCPVAPSTPPASPTPTDTPTDPGAGGDQGSTNAGSPSNAATTQLGDDTPVSPTPGSVVLNHTPAAGAPVVDSPVIQNACAGTVYTTSAIPEPADTPTP